jgi:hypothetical protein
MQNADHSHLLSSGMTYFLIGLLLYALVSLPESVTVHAQQPGNPPPVVPNATRQVSPGPTSSSQTEEQRKGDDPAEMRQTIKRLRNENERLRRRISDLEHGRNVTSIQNQLSREEERVDRLRNQLLTTIEKLGEVELQMDEVNEQLRPENIERMFIAGSVRPEEVRETTRRRLNREKRRLQSQLDLLQQSRSRFQSSLSAAEVTIQRLQLQLQGPSHR